MKAFRYNSKKREDRGFNNCGKEKNPNQLRFYASNLAYAEKYRYIYSEYGELMYECELETIEVGNKNLFNMCEGFKALNTYKNYIDSEIGSQLRDYTAYMNEAKNAKSRKMWAKNIDDLKNREQEIQKILFNLEFQPLSDFEIQNELFAELKALGFDGYTTQNEIVIL